MKLVITGSIATDYLMTFPGQFTEHILPDKLDHISLSFLVDSMKKQQGGTAANIAYSLALLGEKPLLVGAVGRDFEDYRRFLTGAGVDTQGAIVFPEAFTASFFANTDQAGNQICSFYTGAMQYAKQVTLKSQGVALDDLVIVSPNDPEAMIMLAEECRSLTTKFICDPGQQIARFDGEQLKQLAQGSQILILNEYEYGLFLDKTGMGEQDLFGLCETLIVTLGEKGARICLPANTVDIPIARPETVLDPTGVGDAFRAGLMKGLIHRFTWETAGRMGSLAAAYVLETDGPQSHHYGLEQFIDRYVRTFGDSDEIAKLIQ
ncbi:carbohydrate kinase family protein [bacterium]|nr:carbohydrate kinase family protein [bacterium]